MTSSPFTRVITAGVLACALPGAAVVLAPPAQAHTALASSDPSDKSTLPASPGEIALTFNEKMDGAYARVAVTGPDDRSVASGSATAKGRTVTQRLTAAVPAGRYTVAFRVVSTDGHPVTGSLTYTVTPPPAPAASSDDTAASPEPTATPTATPSTHERGGEREGVGVSTIAAVGAVVLITAASATAYRLRQRRGRDGA
ncbi:MULTISPECIES: copper resistance protein CopC [unclassified Streptomyces]|uniref:copper resistance CopC family protein n=1 Tax=unclassified Streptomyces TaxID=2593676 RepID=UPI00362838DB